MQTVSFCFPKICFLDWNNWCKDRRIIGAGIGGRGKETQMTQPGQKRNYQREMEQIMEREGREGRIPSLLLHSCCAPCSSYVLEYLSRYFDITVYYYNPNIAPKEEYETRVKEQERLIREMGLQRPVKFLAGEYVTFMQLQRAMRRTRRAGNGALGAMNCAWPMLPGWLPGEDMTILQPHFPSVP